MTIMQLSSTIMDKLDRNLVNLVIIFEASFQHNFNKNYSVYFLLKIFYSVL